MKNFLGCFENTIKCILCHRVPFHVEYLSHFKQRIFLDILKYLLDMSREMYVRYEFFILFVVMHFQYLLNYVIFHFLFAESMYIYEFIFEKKKYQMIVVRMIVSFSFYKEYAFSLVILNVNT